MLAQDFRLFFVLRERPIMSRELRSSREHRRCDPANGRGLNERWGAFNIFFPLISFDFSLAVTYNTSREIPTFVF